LERKVNYDQDFSLLEVIASEVIRGNVNMVDLLEVNDEDFQTVDFADGSQACWNCDEPLTVTNFCSCCGAYQLDEPEGL
jgi:hypothetical protein